MSWVYAIEEKLLPFKCFDFMTVTILLRRVITIITFLRILYSLKF